MLPRRRVKLPHKQLVYWLFDDFVRELGPVDTALEVACGDMTMAEYVPAKHYIGVDVERALIEQGQRRYGHAEGYVSRIEDMDAHLKGDFVFCLQCIGIDAHFNAQATLLCVQRMVDATKEGGALLFNIGPRSLEWHDLAEDAIRSKFAALQVLRYGRFRSVRRSSLLALGLSAMMRQFPALADGSRPLFRLFMCRGKT